MLYIVLNSQAGSGQAGREWPEIAHALLRRGQPFCTLSAPDLPALQSALHELPADATVLAIGGDGTAMGVLPALVGTQRRLALMPYGTGNDLAGMLGLRSGDIEGALQQLEQPPCLVDTLEVSFGGQTYPSLSGIGMGFDAEVNKASDHAPPWVTQLFGGIGRYAWGALMAFGGMRFVPLRLWVDGELMHSGPSCLSAIMNSTRYGGGFYISPASDVRDGQLNVLCTQGTFSHLRLLELMLLVLRGKHLGHPHVLHRLGHSARAQWQQPVRVQVDGDLFENVREVEVRVRPQSLWVHNANCQLLGAAQAHTGR